MWLTISFSLHIIHDVKFPFPTAPRPHFRNPMSGVAQVLQLQQQLLMVLESYLWIFLFCLKVSEQNIESQTHWTE